MAKKTSLRNSILYTCTAFFVLQCAGFFLVQIRYKIPLREVYAFYPICLVLHVLLCFVLLKLRGRFLSLPDRQPVHRVNVPTMFTLFRLSSLAGLPFLVSLTSRFRIWPVLIILLFLVFITDLLDGMLARRLRQKTEVGGILDSTSDYILLIMISAAYLYYRLLPFWFFLAVILRLSFQGLFMLILFFRHRRLHAETTMWGKVAVFAVMSLYIIAPAMKFGLPLLVEKTSAMRLPGAVSHAGNTITAITAYAVAGLLAVSLADKILWFAKKAASSSG